MSQPEEEQRRVIEHPVLGALPAVPTVTFTWNGTQVTAREGEPIAAALLAAGVRVLRRSERAGTTRGVYCNIGHCFECRVDVDGATDVRSCLTPVRNGMSVRSQTTRPADDTEAAS